MIERGDSLTLVEAGLGVFDALAPRRRLQRFLLPPAHPSRRRTVRQALERAGLSPDNVEHIVVTHLHRDNIGGISDFPLAKIHARPGSAVTALFEARRAAVPQLALGNRYVPPRPELTDWYGFRAHRVDIDAAELLLIDLPGHTLDHAGVVVRLDSGYVVHLGHALLSLDELLMPKLAVGAKNWARLWEDERPFAALETRERLRRLARDPKSPLTFVSGRGVDKILSLGPHPFPSIEIL